MIKVALYFLIVVFMIALIPVIQNDFVLAAIYATVAITTLVIGRHENDVLFLVFGFVSLFISEYLFISTGVETFNRKTLLGVMPLWLPFLWAYVFMVMARSIRILDKR